MKTGVPDGDLLRERQACWDYTTGTEMVRLESRLRPGACEAPALLTELCSRKKWWERRVLPSLPLACQASALLVSYTPDGNGAGERNRTVVSALAQPHSAVEPHPQKLVSPAGLSPAT